MLRKVNLVTSSYPFLEGEQFLESEMAYWDSQDILLIPLQYSEDRRDIGDKICDDSVAKALGLTPKKFNVKYFFKTLLTHDFYLEILRKPSLLCKKRELYNLFRFIYFGLLLSDIIESKYGKELKPEVIFYTYWFNWSTYGLTRLKKKGYQFKLITRAHRVDLYNYAQVGSYMPLNKSYAKHVDEIHSISQDGKQHMIDNYKIEPSKIIISKLGVADRYNEKSSQKHNSSNVHFLSISYLKPLKRVLLISEMVEAYQSKYPNIQVNWTHIGAGEQFQELTEKAIGMRVKVNLLGQLANSDLLKFLNENVFDVFINLSESEGIPVSIMEAMSYGVPVVATDVGGTSEAVSSKVGALLKKNFKEKEFLAAVDIALGLNRSQVYSFYKSNYSAKVNYKKFVDSQCRGY